MNTVFRMILAGISSMTNPSDSRRCIAAYAALLRGLSYEPNQSVPLLYRRFRRLRLVHWRYLRSNNIGGAIMTDFIEAADAFRMAQLQRLTAELQREKEAHCVMRELAVDRGERIIELAKVANELKLERDGLARAVDDLKAENGRLTRMQSAFFETMEKLDGLRPFAPHELGKHLVDVAKDRIEALRQDAERYRWFRDCGGEWNDVMVLDSHGRLICEELDDHIDEVMSNE